MGTQIIYTVEELTSLPRLTTVHSGWGDVYHSNFPTRGEPVVWWDKRGDLVDPRDICFPAVVLDGPVHLPTN